MRDVLDWTHELLYWREIDSRVPLDEYGRLVGSLVSCRSLHLGTAESLQHECHFIVHDAERLAFGCAWQAKRTCLNIDYFVSFIADLQLLNKGG